MGRVIKKLNTSNQNVVPVKNKMKLVKNIWRPLINYVPRRNLMEEIEKIFPLKTNYVFISGIGGSGKSEFIRKYVSMVADSYAENICMMNYCGSIRETINKELLFCTDYQTSTEIEKRFERMSRQEIFYNKMQALKQTDKCLLVIDNFENIEDENLQYLLDSNADIIFLTRDKIKNDNSLDITDKISIQEEIQIFKSVCLDIDLDEKVIQELCGTCDKHPMTIVLLASLISLNKYELHIIFEGFKTSPKKKFSEKILFEKDRGFRQKQIMRHFDTLFSFYGLSEQQEQLLLDISFAYPQVLNYADYFEKKYVEFQSDIKVLEKLNLIRVENSMVHIHPLLAENVLDVLRPDMSRCRNVLHYFEELFKKKTVDDYCLGTMVINASGCFEEYDMDYHKMMMYGAKYLFCQSRYDSAIQVYEYILRFVRDELKYVQVKYQLGLNFKHAGRYNDSLRIYSEIQEVCVKYSDSIEYKQTYIPVLIGIANNYHMLGESEKRKKTQGIYYKSALDYYKKALHLSKTVDGVCSARCASIYDNMALMHANLGQFACAYSNSALARRMFRELEGEESFELAICYINLGEINRLNLKMEAALNAYKTAEEIKEKILPQNHDSHIVTYINIGEMLILLERLDEAERYFIKAREITSLKFPITHLYNEFIKKGLAEIEVKRDKVENL